MTELQFINQNTDQNSMKNYFLTLMCSLLLSSYGYSKNDGDDCIEMIMTLNLEKAEMTISAKNTSSISVTMEDFFYEVGDVPWRVELATYDEFGAPLAPILMGEGTVGYNPNYAISFAKRPYKQLTIPPSKSLSKTFKLKPFFEVLILEAEKKAGNSSPDLLRSNIEKYTFQVTKFAKGHRGLVTFPKRSFSISPDSLDAEE